jgi:hypothetical protein
VLIEELRSIAKSVDFHLGAGASAEGRAADEIEWLRRRVAALERVIRENLDPSHCNDGPDRKIVQEIVRRQASLPALSHASLTPQRSSRPADLNGKGDNVPATADLAGKRATVQRQPVEGFSSGEHEPTLSHDWQLASAIADTEFESADRHLVEMAQQVQAALLRGTPR